MNKLLLVVFVSAATLIGGCTLFSPPRPIGVSPEMSEALQKAQAAVNEANILITATAIVVNDGAKSGIFTKSEALSYLGKIDEFTQRAKDAQALIDSGFPDAQNQAELMHRLVLALHREVAQRARSNQ